MKPTKNRIFCADAGRAKMLFTSEKKADNFIRFNAEEMLSEGRKIPVRSYYCNVCCGWHVTSSEHWETKKYASRYDMYVAKHTELMQRVSRELGLSTSARKLRDTYYNAELAYKEGRLTTAARLSDSLYAQLRNHMEMSEYRQKADQQSFNILCGLIPQVFSYIQEENYEDAKKIFSICKSIQSRMRKVAGFDEYKKVTDEYINQAKIGFDKHKSVCDGIVKMNQILGKIDTLHYKIEEGDYSMVQTSIDQLVQNLTTFVGVKDETVRKMVYDGVIRLMKVRDELTCKLGVAA